MILDYYRQYPRTLGTAMATLEQVACRFRLIIPAATNRCIWSSDQSIFYGERQRGLALTRSLVASGLSITRSGSTSAASSLVNALQNISSSLSNTSRLSLRKDGDSTPACMAHSNAVCNASTRA